MNNSHHCPRVESCIVLLHGAHEVSGTHYNHVHKLTGLLMFNDKSYICQRDTKNPRGPTTANKTSICSHFGSTSPLVLKLSKKKTVLKKSPKTLVIQFNN